MRYDIPVEQMNLNKAKSCIIRVAIEQGIFKLTKNQDLQGKSRTRFDNDRFISPLNRRT